MMFEYGRGLRAFCILSVFVTLAGCAGNGDSPVAPTATPTSTSTPTTPPSATPTRSSTPSPSFSTTPTLTNTATNTEKPTATPTATPSRTQTPLPTSTASPSATATASASATATFEPGTCNDPAVQAVEPLCALDSATVACEFLIEENCLYPYPSSFFLKPDSSTATGYRVNFTRPAMPANTRKIRVDPTEWNTLDGFSPGSMILSLFPQGVDLVASGAAQLPDYRHSIDADSPTVLLDADTGEHVLHFVELDAQATKDSTRALIIRPGVRLKERGHYIVAIRGLKDLNGSAIEARHAFQILRDGLDTPVNAIKARRSHFEDIFTKLEGAGVARNNLLLAWDFVVASSEALTSRAVSARDQALAANGPGAPPFEITSVEDNYNDKIFRRVRGTFTVPLFMTSSTPPASYNLDSNGVPQQNGTTTAPFTIIIPRVDVEGAQPQPGRALIYGHGLLGSGEGEITSGPQQSLASRFGFVIGATDWIGLSENDVNNSIRILADFSHFNQLADRLQQAFINFIFLGRLMTSENGLNSRPEFQFNGVPIINTQELYYDGNSQGGIEGGAYLALSPDTKRGVLGVGAANYSTLLQRSVDFDTFQFVFKQNYLNELDRAVLFGLIQQLWDRGEPNGYTSHLISNPLPNTPAKKVLLQNGINDSQVAHIATVIQARSLGIPAVAPSAYPSFGIPEMEAPFDGSAWTPYDVHGSPPPLANIAPPFENGVHEAVRRLDEAQLQIDAFLRPDGSVQNFCGGPCSFTNVPNVQ
ncbi:MAG: hypothetical protein HY270_18360 [Deltaproteobacteria bacterium]|nr:hypothetical protein [Deltaproteobacteria bacterium]